MLLTVAMLMSSCHFIYAGEIKEERRESVLKENYVKMEALFNQVEELFPEVYIGVLPSYDEYRNGINAGTLRTASLDAAVTEKYEKEVNNCDIYILELYDNGTFSLMSGTRLWGGSSWTSQSSGTYTFYYSHYLVTYTASASFKATQSLYAGSYRFTDLTFLSSSYCTYYSLGYYYGNTNQAVFYGSVVEFNMDLGDYVEVAKVRLMGTVNQSTGAVSVEHMYVPYFGY